MLISFEINKVTVLRPKISEKFEILVFMCASYVNKLCYFMCW